MSNVDAMRRLKGDIIASYDARVATVEEIVNNTQETLGRFRQERQDMGNELKENLAHHESVRLSAFGFLLDEIRTQRQGRKSELESTLSEAESSRLATFRSLLDTILGRRRERKSEVETTLSEAEAARLEEFKVLLNSYKEEIDGMAATWRNFSKIMQQRRAGVPPEAPPVEEEAIPEVEEEVPVEAAAPVEEEVPSAEEEAAPAEDREELQNRMLSTINSRPNGIRLVDIGGELSVAWRSLIPLARNLVESNQVTKVDVLYYPAGSGLYPQIEEQEAEEADESEEE